MVGSNSFVDSIHACHHGSLGVFGYRLPFQVPRSLIVKIEMIRLCPLLVLSNGPLTCHASLAGWPAIALTGCTTLAARSLARSRIPAQKARFSHAVPCGIRALHHWRVSAPCIGRLLDEAMGSWRFQLSGSSVRRKRVASPCEIAAFDRGGGDGAS